MRAFSPRFHVAEFFNKFAAKITVLRNTVNFQILSDFKNEKSLLHRIRLSSLWKIYFQKFWFFKISCLLHFSKFRNAWKFQTIEVFIKNTVLYLDCQWVELSWGITQFIKKNRRLIRNSTQIRFNSNSTELKC